MKLLQLKISAKLPLVIVVLALISAVVTGVVAFISSEAALEDAAFDKIDAAHDGRIAELTNYLGQISGDVMVVAKNHMAIDALDEVEDAWRELGDDPAAKLQQMYITDNPNEVGQKQFLDAAPDDLLYNRVHAKYHPWFRELADIRGYKDLFLIDDSGNVVYSVHKEMDFATNLKTGKWKDTDLAKVWQGVQENFSPYYTGFTDFAAYAPGNGAPASFIAAAIFDHAGEKHGTLIYQMPVDHLNGIMQQDTGMGRTGETYLVGADLTMRTTSRFTAQGESDILRTKADSKGVEEALAGNDWMGVTTDRHGDETLMVAAPVDFLGVRWAVISNIDMEEVDEPAMAMGTNLAIEVLIILAVMAAAGLWFARTLTRPIVGMTETMHVLADGNLEVEIPSQGRTDEIGEMAAAVQVFKDNAIEVKHLEAEQKEAEVRQAREKRELMMKMADDFESSVGGVVETVSSAATEMQSSATTLSSTAEETSNQSSTVAAAAEEASTNVETVASASEELSSSISEISRQVAQSTQISATAVAEVNSANEQVQGLAEAAHKIGEVVALITDIADQTNLLALNATIEAARAGEAGKGFAVVASEVKNLANQTAKATEEISAQIGGIQGATQDAVQAIRDIGDIITKMNEIASTIASAVEEQGAATQEIARNVEQAAAGTAEVSSNIQGVQQAASETGASSGQMLGAAKELSQQAELLRGEVGKFLVNIRNG